MEYNGVEIEQLENGKWRLTDLHTGETRDYRTEYLARKLDLLSQISVTV